MPVKDNNNPTISIIGNRNEMPANAQAIQLKVECVFFLEDFGVSATLYVGITVGCAVFTCGADGETISVQRADIS